MVRHRGKLLVAVVIVVLGAGLLLLVRRPALPHVDPKPAHVHPEPPADAPVRQIRTAS